MVSRKHAAESFILSSHRPQDIEDAEHPFLSSNDTDGNGGDDHDDIMELMDGDSNIETIPLTIKANKHQAGLNNSTHIVTVKSHRSDVEEDDDGNNDDHNDNDDDGNNNNNIDNDDSKTMTPLQKLLASPFVVMVLQMSNILAWYWTNGMNGISMQSYATQVNDPSHQISPLMRFLSTLAITNIVTCWQLLLGAIIGRVLLRGLNPSITWKHIANTHWLPLSGLHALGSIATNVGFMYGKASLVQVIKLLEPFETLLLSQLFFPKEGKCTMGIVSSMMVVVGAAMSLLQLQSTPPHPLSIIFAILSGLTLSCRNVLQRKHHHHVHDGGVSAQQWSKLDKSVVQFTQLSFYSALWTGAFAVAFFLLIRPYFVMCSMQVLLWHPLYNVFSMITLGFCSALTHSLLNAGKRVFAICMAMLWFREGLNPATLAGLALVGVGGSWYSLESKRTKENVASSPEYNKLFRSIAALIILLWFQRNYS